MTIYYGGYNPLSSGGTIINMMRFLCQLHKNRHSKWDRDNFIIKYKFIILLLILKTRYYSRSSL